MTTCNVARLTKLTHDAFETVRMKSKGSLDAIMWLEYNVASSRGNYYIYIEGSCYSMQKILLVVLLVGIKDSFFI